MQRLAADPHGDENVQRWAAAGLPVPPSWRIGAESLRGLSRDQLVAALGALPEWREGDRYWVLHQGSMNPDSQRESLANLDSDEALATALWSMFNRDPAPPRVVIQALPRQRAAGVLFTRHPLRQDLAHMVVEGVLDGEQARQRLIFDERGALVYAGDGQRPALSEVVPQTQLLALGSQLRRGFERPQAGEWVHDGEQLWLLQTLPVGSLPVPREAWTRRAAATLFNQAVSPLWYTLAGRWMKTGFWQDLVARQGWRELDKVEPYRRQQSHLYTNSEFFRRLLPTHPGLLRRVPPAWQPLENQVSASRPRRWSQWRRGRRLGTLGRRVRRWRLDGSDRERLWRALMALDQLGERLAAEEGALVYLDLPDLACGRERPLPLRSLLTDQETQALEAVLNDNVAALANSDLRPGADPVHAPLKDRPAQWGSLRAPLSARRLAPPVSEPASATLALARQARQLRYQLGGHARHVLVSMAAVLVEARLLANMDDIHFLYFDELWPLWMQRRVPESASGEVIGQRKLRYLEDALSGAPDWKMDRIGFGFGGGERPSPLLRGRTLVPGRVSGPVRRVCSAWALNRLQAGEILVIDQADPSWVPWLAQAGALVIAEQDPANAAASLAVACGIPAIWGVGDIMHSVVDGQTATLDGERGSIEVGSGEQDEGDRAGPCKSRGPAL
ncbi:pyruvate, phosphate dikinase [Alcanivorax sp. N3-2A]|nr:pyruvate, phosphate dikinase [Alcanivorax sp. N3-2A]|tara:strand:- start:3427 stop:5451 length:2025 start_codon:yes stop_codon:yes gene_type:complete